MAAKWVREQPKNDDPFEMRVGKLLLYVDKNQDQVWNSAYITVCFFSPEGEELEDRMEKWPLEAIQRLRAELDKVERQLNNKEPVTDETTV